MTPTTAVARPRTAMAEYFRTEDFQLGVRQALPKHCSADRFTRILLTALLKEPKLAECTKESLLEKAIQVAALGLECDGRRAHLIPFMNKKKGAMEVQLIVDYKGLVELIYRSGEVMKLHGDIVCDNDKFVYNKGEIVIHEIDFRRDRGEPYACYTEAVMKSGMVSACVMSKAEIEYVRSKSNSPDSLMWTDFWGEGGKKTCLRRHSKWLPFSPDLREKVEAVTDEFDDIKRARGPEVVAPNFLTDAPPYTTEATVEVPTGGTAVNPPAPAVEAPKQTRKPKAAAAPNFLTDAPASDPRTIIGVDGKPIAPGEPDKVMTSAAEAPKQTRKPKPAAAPTPPPQEPAPIDVQSEVTQQPEPPADIEPPPVETPAPAPQSELEALLVANGASWAQVAKHAAAMGWFGETKLTDSVDTLPQIQQDWLKKNVRGICKLAGKVVV